jgi:ribose 5-phosphate isomerase B
MPTPDLTEAELHALVSRVVQRTLGRPGPAPAAVTPPAAAVAKAESKPAAGGQGSVALGADHGGYALKETLKALLTELGYSVVDCGTHSTDPVDYPDLAYAVARLVSSGQAWRGILVDGAGIGSAMAANKVPGIRAALCYDHYSAVNSREHNDANVLTLGAGLIGPNLAKHIVQTWLATPFAGGRHQKRVDKIVEIEQRFLKDRA